MVNDNLNSKAIRFLSDKMEPNEREEFERELENDQNLANLINDLKLIDEAGNISKNILGDHLSRELITQYCDNPNDLNDGELNKLQIHLKSCNTCQKKVEFCTKINDMIQIVDQSRLKTTKTTHDSDSLFKRIANFLFTPQFVFRPALGLGLIILLIIPAVYFMSSGEFSHDPYKLKAVTRATESRNVVTIDPDQEMVSLEFRVHVIENLIYDFEIYDSESNLIILKPSNKALFDPESDMPKPFILEIPSSYLLKGNYRLVVKEYENSIVQDTFIIIFEVEIK